MHRSSGGSIDGQLADIDGGALDRLDHVMAALGADRAQAPVRYLCAPAAEPFEWRADQWDEGDRLLWLALIAEILDLIGKVDPALIYRHLDRMRARVWARHLAQNAPKRPSDTPKNTPIVHDLTPVHFGFFRFDTVVIEQPQFDGAFSPALPRELYVSSDAALVLPYDPVSDEVLLIEQFRLGPWRRGDAQPWSLEPIAGMIDPGEDPETCARREAEEEAHLSLTELERITAGYASPGYSTGFFHMFLAVTDLSDTHGRIGGAVSESENIRTHVMPFSRALELAETGGISVVPLQLMLFWLAGNRGRLRSGT